jgi:hypothetical protein
MDYQAFTNDSLTMMALNGRHMKPTNPGLTSGVPRVVQACSDLGRLRGSLTGAASQAIDGDED